MKLSIEVLFNGVIYSYNLLGSTDSCRIYLPNEFIIDVFKEHNHLYKFKAFFYHSKTIYSFREYRTKTLLYRAIQNLLKEELYHVLQY